MSNWFSVTSSNISIEYLNITDFPVGTYGFIYKVTHIPTTKSYIGKKSLYHNVKHKLTKKQLTEYSGRGRKPTHETLQKESDWKNYYGSEEFIKQKIKENKQNEFTREILHLVPNKKLLTYYECKYQFMYGVLESEDWINSNILGKFYKKDFE
jgi:hypothetical protein